MNVESDGLRAAFVVLVSGDPEVGSSGGVELDFGTEARQEHPLSVNNDHIHIVTKRGVKVEEKTEKFLDARVVRLGC